MHEITSGHAHLEHIKLSLCGPSNSGKTCLRDSLERSTLQLLLGRESEGSQEEGEGGGGKKRHTYGIEIRDLKISGGNETYHVWDFSGDLGSYTSHSHFLSTAHTIYTLVLDLSQSLPQIRSDALYWLGLIKMRNLGKRMPYQHRERLDTARLSPKIQQKVVKGGTLSKLRTVSVPAVTKFRSRLYSSSFAGFSTSLKPKLSRSTSPSHLIPSPSSTLSPGVSPQDVPISFPSPYRSPSSPLSPCSEVGDLPAWSTVPVIVVGSRYDLLSEKLRSEVIQNLEGFFSEMASKFHPFLEVLPRVMHMNCVKPTSSDIKLLKEQISLFRAVQTEVRDNEYSNDDNQ